MPQIGAIEPGLWVASGFGGHGLNTTAMAGELIARGIVENDETWRLFAPYELVWAGGLLGRVLAQGLYWGSRPVNSVEAGLARYREKARARKAARQEARAAARANGKAKAAACKPCAPKACARKPADAPEKLAPEETAALAAIAEVAEAEQRAVTPHFTSAAPPVMPPTMEDRVAHIENTSAPEARPPAAPPKPFGRRKGKPRKPK